MINSIKKTGHLSNSFFFHGFGGFIGLICYYYWTKEISRIMFCIIQSFIALMLLASLLFNGFESTIKSMVGYLFIIILSGILGLIIGAIVGEPDWKKDLKKENK